MGSHSFPFPSAQPLRYSTITELWWSWKNWTSSRGKQAHLTHHWVAGPRGVPQMPYFLLNQNFLWVRKAEGVLTVNKQETLSRCFLDKRSSGTSQPACAPENGAWWGNRDVVWTTAPSTQTLFARWWTEGGMYWNVDISYSISSAPATSPEDETGSDCALGARCM